ncbi:MAG: hypothetical protein ABIO43_13525 [Sphingomicrobium sp.]
MSETLAWLLYLVAAALAFAAVYYKNWPITLSMLAATALTTLVWYAAVELGKEANEPTWINVDLALNASFALIFAGAGAGLGMCLRSNKRAAESADDER